MPKNNLAKRLGKEILFTKEDYSKCELVKGYNTSEIYCFVRLNYKGSAKKEEKKYSISEILGRTRDKARVYQEVKAFMDNLQESGEFTNMYALAALGREKKNNLKRENKKKDKSKEWSSGHSYANLEDFQKGLRRDIFPNNL